MVAPPTKTNLKRETNEHKRDEIERIGLKMMMSRVVTHAAHVFRIESRESESTKVVRASRLSFHGLS
ncbi:hypothetical protein WN51_05775 [Melipona quadrifasciata]|uniref:Uncharacterized protein n=1 Tax=Melipona quadrifasciata TaxID=166423 RepID=A0A0M9A899_9HYME|nr:hypothetical protein WN51_05775 [Melipona quadrifasciata]